MNNDLIKLLLQAELNTKDSIANIQEQLKNISDNIKPIEIKFDLDQAKFKDLKLISEQLQKQMAGGVKLNIDTTQAEKGLARVTDHYTKGEEVVKRQTKTTIAGYEKTVELLDLINKKSIKKDVTYDFAKEQKDIESFNKVWEKAIWENEQRDKKSIEAIADAREKSIARAIKEQEKLNQAQAKASNKAIEDNYKLQQAEEQRFKKLEINVDNFKQKMLGVGGFQGEMDIFADKQKGKYSENLFSQLKDDIANFNTQSPNAEQNLKQLQIQWNLLKQSAAESGNVMARAAENMFKFLRYYLVGGVITNIVGELRQGVQGIKELDSSLVSLGKVADLSSQQLADITDRAYELGNAVARTGREVIDATTLFSRMGFSVNESLLLAEEALLMVNVGDNVGSVENAADSIIAALKGFNVSAEDSVVIAKKINDMYNEVSNNFAVSTGDLANGVKRSSAVLSQAGVSMEQNIGLLTGAFEVLQNMERSSVGISTISQRLLGMDEDNNAIDGLSAKLEKEFNALGLTLMDANGQIKDTYSILKSLAEVYPTLTKNQRAYIGELTSGKNRAPVLQAILSNWENVEKATEAAKNSANSAIIENERYMESIEAKSKQLASSTETFFKNLIDPNDIKTSVDLLNSLVKTMDTLVNNPMSDFIIKAGLMTTGWMLFVKAWGIFNNSLLFNNIGNIALNLLAATTSVGTFTAAVKAAGAAMMASPLFIPAMVSAGILGLIKAIDHFTTSLKEQKEVVETLSSDIQSLQSEYDKLKSTEDRTEEQETYLKLLEQELMHKQDLLKIEKEREIEQEFFTTSVKGKDARVVDSGANEIKKSIAELKKLQDELRNIDTQQEGNKKKWDEINEKIINIQLSLGDSLKTLTSGIEVLKKSQELDPNANIIIPQEWIDLANLIKTVTVEQDNLADSIDSVNDEAYQQVETLEDLTKKFEDITSKIQTYNVFLSEMSTKEGLSAKSKQEIITKHQELLPYIDDEKELRKQLIRIISEEESAQKQAYISMIMVSEDFFNAKVKGNKELYEKLKEYYGQNLEDAKSLAHAKELIENELIKNLSGKWAKYYNVLTTNHNQLLEDNLVRSAMAGNTDAAKVLEAANEFKKMENRFNEIALKGSNIDFKSINMANVKDPKTKKDKKEYSAEVDRYDKINQQLEQSNNLLAKNKTLQDLAGDDITKKIKLQEEQIKLEKEQQQLLHEKANIARQERVELEKSLSKQGFKFAGEGDNREITNLDKVKGKTKEVEEQFKRYKDIQSKEIPSLQQSWMNLSKSIQDVSSTIKDLNRQIFEAQRDSIYNTYSDGIRNLEHLISLERELIELTSNKNDKVEMQLKVSSLTESQIHMLKELNSQREYELDLMREIGDVESNRYKSLLDDYRSTELKILQLQRQQKQEYESVANEIISAIKDGYREMLELEKASVNQKVKLAEEEYNKKIKLLDDWLSHHNEIIDEMLKDMNRLNEAEDYDEQLDGLKKQRVDAEDALNKALDLSDNAVDKDIRVADARKELEKINSDIDKLMRDRARALRKQELQDTKDQNSKIVEDKKNSEQAKIDSVKSSAEREIQIIEQKYDALINNDRMYEAIREDIMKGTYTSANEHISRILNSLQRQNASTVSSMGRSWQELENIILGVVRAQKQLQNLGQYGDISQDSTSNGFSSANLDKQIIGDLQRKYMKFVEENTRDRILKEQEENGYLWKLNQEAERIRKKYGWGYADYSHLSAPGYSQGGVVDFTGVANVHGSKTSAEVVFNAGQAKKLYELVKNLPAITPDFIMNKIPSIATPLFKKVEENTASKSNGNNVYNINLNIDKVTGDADGGKQVFKQLVKEVRLRGGII